MSDSHEIGFIEHPPTVRIPIINCTQWRLREMRPVCLVGMDLQCSSCAARIAREGPLSVDGIFDHSVPPAPPRTNAPASEPDRKFRGLGDVVAAVTSAVGVKPCEGCKRRQERLNRAVPFGPSSTVDKPL